LSLRIRLTLTYSVLLAVAITALGVLLYVTMGRALNEEADRRLEVRAEEAQVALWDNSPTLQVLNAEKLDATPLGQIDSPGLGLEVLDLSGQVRGASRNLQDRPLPLDDMSMETARSGKAAFEDLEFEGGRVVRVLYAPVLVNGKAPRCCGSANPASPWWKRWPTFVSS
jgi:hypothetical protein